MTFQLRPYQDQLIDAAREALRTHHSVLMVAPTGAGKTALAAHMLGTAASRQKRAWFIVHRRELLRQSSITFRKVGIDHGLIGAGFTPNHRALVQVAGIQTLANRLDLFPAPDMIVWDECHHVASASWAKIFSRFPDVRHIGLTATPVRLDGRGLGDWFTTLVEGPTTASLIDAGYLAPYRLFAPSAPNLTGVHKRGGDFVNSEVAAEMDKPSITGDAIGHYRRLAHGKRAIVFAANIQHSIHIAEAFQQAGYRAAHLDGTTDNARRDQILRRFESGEIQIVSNVDLFGEGFDLPAIEAVILMRPTASTGLYLQQVGRGLRTFDGKTEAIILDHAGNALRHGLPDEIREWDLDAKKKKPKGEKDDGPAVKQCPTCYAVHAPAPKCPGCGHVYAPDGRKIEVRDGELVEIDQAVIRENRKREQAQARTLEDLIALGKARDYQNPVGWARNMIRARGGNPQPAVG